MADEIRLTEFDRMAHPQVWTYPYEYERERLSARQEGRHPKSVVVVLRGLPGTGKTTFASLMSLFAASRGLETAICSADAYFEGPDGYQFRLDHISRAHEYCKGRFEDALRRRVPLVVVDNTNISVMEYLPYLDTARGNILHILHFQVRSEAEAIRFGRRSRHGVPPAVVLRRFNVSIQHEWRPIPFEDVDPIENTWDNDFDFDEEQDEEEF